MTTGSCLPAWYVGQSGGTGALCGCWVHPFLAVRAAQNFQAKRMLVMKVVMVTPAPSVTFSYLTRVGTEPEAPHFTDEALPAQATAFILRPSACRFRGPSTDWYRGPRSRCRSTARLILAPRCQGRDEQPTLEMRALEVTKPISTPFWWLPVLSPRTEASASPDHVPSFFVSTATRSLNYFCVDNKHRGAVACLRSHRPLASTSLPAPGPRCPEQPSFQRHREHRHPFPRADAPPSSRRSHRARFRTQLCSTIALVPEREQAKPRPAVARVAALPRASLMTLDQYLSSLGFSVLICEMGVVVLATDTRCVAPGALSVHTSDGVIPLISAGQLVQWGEQLVMPSAVNLRWCLRCDDRPQCCLWILAWKGAYC